MRLSAPTWMSTTKREASRLEDGWPRGSITWRWRCIGIFFALQREYPKASREVLWRVFLINICGISRATFDYTEEFEALGLGVSQRVFLNLTERMLS